MAHAQKLDFVSRRNERFHLNRRGRQFSRLLSAEVCVSALVMLDTPRSEVVWEYWLPTPFASFPFTSPPVRHHVPSGFKRTLPCLDYRNFNPPLGSAKRWAWPQNLFKYKVWKCVEMSAYKLVYFCDVLGQNMFILLTVIHIYQRQYTHSARTLHYQNHSNRSSVIKLEQPLPSLNLKCKFSTTWHI